MIRRIFLAGLILVVLFLVPGVYGGTASGLAEATFAVG